MHLFIKLHRALTRFSYFRGTLRAKLICRKIGEKCLIHKNTHFLSPEKIMIGNNCEIKHGVLLDGRGLAACNLMIMDNTKLKEYVSIYAYGGRITLGENTIIGKSTTIFGHGDVHIGKYSMIGPSTTIVSSDHVAYLQNISFQHCGFTREAITIGQNCWIGSNCSILAGAVIKDNVIVAAGSVVKGVLDENFIYGGIPAKPIKPIPVANEENRSIFYVTWDLFNYDKK